MDKIFLRRQMVSLIFLLLPGITYLIFYFFEDFLFSHIITFVLFFVFHYLNFVFSFVALARFAADYRDESGFFHLAPLAIFILLAAGAVLWTGYWAFMMSDFLFFSNGFH